MSRRKKLQPQFVTFIKAESINSNVNTDIVCINTNQHFSFQAVNISAGYQNPGKNSKNLTSVDRNLVH